MLHKSSHFQRESYSWFMVALEKVTVIDINGKPKCKRHVFEQLFNPADNQNTELKLIVSGVHPYFAIIPRQDIIEANRESRRITEATKQVIQDRAVAILRHYESMPDFTTVVKRMVEIGMQVLNDCKEIEEEIKVKVCQQE